MSASWHSCLEAHTWGWRAPRRAAAAPPAQSYIPCTARVLARSSQIQEPFGRPRTSRWPQGCRSPAGRRSAAAGEGATRVEQGSSTVYVGLLGKLLLSVSLDSSSSTGVDKCCVQMPSEVCAPMHQQGQQGNCSAGPAPHLLSAWHQLSGGGDVGSAPGRHTRTHTVEQGRDCRQGRAGQVHGGTAFDRGKQGAVDVVGGRALSCSAEKQLLHVRQPELPAFCTSQSCSQACQSTNRPRRQLAHS